MYGWLINEEIAGYGKPDGGDLGRGRLRAVASMALVCRPIISGRANMWGCCCQNEAS
jgi:hypothetical protein